MKRILFSTFYAASLLYGAICPMPMASAMPTIEPILHVEQSEMASMSPYIPMSLAAPMSVAPVATYHASGSASPALAICPGGNCIMTAHAQSEEIAVFAAAGEVRGGTMLPTTGLSSLDPGSSPSASPAPPDTSLTDAIGTVVLRV